MSDEERMANLFVSYCDVVGAALVRAHAAEFRDQGLPHEREGDPFTRWDLAEMRRLYRLWLRSNRRVMAKGMRGAPRATLDAYGRELFTNALRRFLQ
jgi:hypothetical protein